MTQSESLHEARQELPVDEGGSSSSSIDAGQPQCRFLPLVSNYHDGELREEQARELAGHMSSCRSCSESLAFLNKLSGKFSTWSPPRLGDEAGHSFKYRGREIIPPAAVVRSRAPADVRWVRRLTAVAAALFVVAAFQLTYNYHSRQTIPGGGPSNVIISPTTDGSNQPNFPAGHPLHGAKSRDSSTDAPESH